MGAPSTLVASRHGWNLRLFVLTHNASLETEHTDVMPTMPVTIDVSCVVYVSINCSVENRDNGNVVPRRTMPSAVG